MLLPPPALRDPLHQKVMAAIKTYPQVKGYSQVRTRLPAGHCRTLGGRRSLIDSEKATSSGEVAPHSFVCQLAPESELPAGLKGRANLGVS